MTQFSSSSSPSFTSSLQLSPEPPLLKLQSSHSKSTPLTNFKMQFTTSALVTLTLGALTSLASAQAVAFGQQLQNEDQTNHWVAWVEGEHACPGMQVLTELTESPCEQAFQLGTVLYEFTGCSGENGAPTAILDSGGLQVGGCSPASDKINCHDGLHDIIKHGVCTIVIS